MTPSRMPAASCASAACVVSFNSDSSDHARRMNLEAAKAVKYGGTPEEEALKFVTLNPAKQLGIDQMGRLARAGQGWRLRHLERQSARYHRACVWKRGSTGNNTSNATPPTAAPKRVKAERLALIDKGEKARRAIPASDARRGKAQEKFFFRALEDRQNHLCVDCCLDHEMPWKN